MEGRSTTFRRNVVVVVFGLLLLIAPESFAQSSSDPSIGPKKGWLVLHGGGIGVEKDDGPIHHLVALAGGPKASIVVILTPIDLDVLTTKFFTQYKEWWTTGLGVSDVTFMDTRDRRLADTEDFVAPLRKATGVWITGGHLTNLLDSYLNTRTMREIAAVAERGGAIGGSSAGAMIEGSFLINVTKSPGGMRLSRTGMYLDASRLAGFGVLKNVTVYPHLSAREAQRDVAEVVAHHPELLGIGIDEGTAIIVHEDQFEVIGAGHIDIFDAKPTSGKKIIILSPGQKFDLDRRLVIN